MFPNNSLIFIFDTHCHLADQKYQGQDIAKIIQQAQEENVRFILNVGYNQLANSKVIEQIVIETDAPYLTPEPLRGQINYPQNIVYTLKKIAEIKKREITEVAAIIYSNTLKLFELKED